MTKRISGSWPHNPVSSAAGNRPIRITCGLPSPRALGLKVSDEFTVPLCRGHHRELHQAGNEVVWWKTLNIDALPIAKGLWEQTHPKSASTVTPQPNDDAAKATAEN